MKKVVVLLCLLVASGTLFSQENSSLHYVRTNDSFTMDPGLSNDLYSLEILANIFEGLVRFRKESLGIEPCLAESWESHDENRHWVFHLRRGVKFHNGAELTSADVLYTFQRHLQHSTRSCGKWKFMFAPLQRVEAPDPLTVEFFLSHEYAPFLVYLADISASVVPQGAYEHGPFHPVGTGPFQFGNREQNRVGLQRHATYWGKPAQVQRLIFSVVRDPRWRLLQLKTGSADLTTLQSEKEYQEIMGRNDIVTRPIPRMSTHYLVFNTRRKPFAQLEARRAVAHLIDKNILVRQVMGNFAVPSSSMIPPDLSEYAPAPPLAEYSFDLSLCRELLRRAGYGGGLKATIYCGEGNPAVEEIVNYLIRQARLVNITLRKVRLPYSRLREAIDHGEHDLLVMGWMGLPDPDYFLFPLVTMETGNVNRSYYQNGPLTQLLQEARMCSRVETRRRLYQHAQEIIHQDLPLLPLYHAASLLALRPQVSGIFTTFPQAPLFREARKQAEK